MGASNGLKGKGLEMRNYIVLFIIGLFVSMTQQTGAQNTQQVDAKALGQQYGLSVSFPLTAKAGEGNTGDVYVSLLKNSEGSMVAHFLFASGSRNYWHLHPDAEQVLLILEGEAYYQEEGQPKRLLKKGDYVVTPANVKHWNGATENSACLCITVTDLTSKEHVVRFGPVTDEEFSVQTQTARQNDPELMAIMQRVYGKDVRNIGNLDLKTRELVSCVALTTLNATAQLNTHINAALDAGATPVEMREVIYLVAPFRGFPFVLNAVEIMNEVFRERGIQLPLPEQGTVNDDTRHETGNAIQSKLYNGGISNAMKGLPGTLGEDMATLLTDFCFGDIYSRNGLSLEMHELYTYVVLTVLQANSQLHSHYLGCLKAGNSPETVVAAVIQCLPHVGFPTVINTLRIIVEMMEQNK